MIGKQIRVRQPRQTLKYISSKDGAVLVGTNLASSTVAGQVQEFEMITAQNTRKEYKYFHVILSLPAGETTDRWQEIVERWQRGMWRQEVKRQFRSAEKGNKGSEPVNINKIAAQVPSFEDCPYVAWQHKDRDHDHIHLLQSVITWEGKVVSDSHNYRRSETVCRAIEQEFGLQRPPNKLGQGGLQHSEHDSLRSAIQSVVADAPSGGLSFELLLRWLLAEGIEVEIPTTRTGKVKGIKYRLDPEGEWISGTELGREYTYPGLAKHLQVQIPDAQTVAPMSIASYLEAVRLLYPGDRELEKDRCKRQRSYYRLEKQAMKVAAENSPSSTPSRTQIDRIVARLLRQQPDLGFRILAQSPAAQRLKQEQGEPAAAAYVHQIVKGLQAQSKVKKQLGR